MIMKEKGQIDREMFYRSAYEYAGLRSNCAFGHIRIFTLKLLLKKWWSEIEIAFNISEMLTVFIYIEFGVIEGLLLSRIVPWNVIEN